MIRLLGVITGAALAVATLLLFVGIPEFKSEATQDERAPVRLPRPTQAVEQPAPAPADTAVSVSALQGEPTAVPEPGHVEAGEPGAIAMPDPQTAAEETGGEVVDVDSPSAPLRETAAASGDGWYVFWSPFSSRIAAEGFVARLQTVTGLDYRIVRRTPGAWEVSFSYVDDDDIASHLSQISAATGLRLQDTP